MTLKYLVAFLLLVRTVTSESIGHVTRDYFGDIFTLLEDCGSCEYDGRRAAHIPGENCRCQCAPSHYVFREDLKQCIKDVGECPVAMFVRPFAVERIPLVFLPMTGQLVYPGAHLTVSGVTRSTNHLSCIVKSSLLMTSHGWQPIRTPSQIFGVYYDGNKTFLQWLGDDEDRRRLQHHLVLIRLLCEEEAANGTFEPCAALRIGYAPGLEPEFADQSANKNNFIIIGLCLGILGLIYVGAVLIYLKVRKHRREAGRQGLHQSHSSIEAAEETNCNTRRNAYINNLVQEAEFTTKGSLKPSHTPTEHDSSSLNTQTKGQTSPRGDDTSSAQPQEFFVRIRGMIAAAKNRLNSFRYHPTLLVIPEDDYFYQDFKERDMDGSRKSRFSSPTSKLESIHGSHLGAAMLEAKLAPPLPPPRNVKKRAPSPPLKGDSRFDLFRLDLYEKINRLRDNVVLERTDNIPSCSTCHDGCIPKEGCCRTLDYSPSSQQETKISRRQLLCKLEETEATVEYSRVHKPKSKQKVHVEKMEEDSSCLDNLKVEEANETSLTMSSRPSTALSNCSAHSSSSQPSTMKTNPLRTTKKESTENERDDLSDCSEVSDTSLSGDSLNSGFREPVKSPISMKTKNYLISSENLSVVSGSSIITSSTDIKEIDVYDDEDYDEDMGDLTTQDCDSRLSTDLDVEMYSLDESEHPSLEEYLQLSSQVAKKLSERTVPAFSNESSREKNALSQFMKEFKTTIGRLKSAEGDCKPRSTSPVSDNWTLKKEEQKATRKVSIFKRNPLKNRKNEELLVTDESEKASTYCDNASATEDTASNKSSNSSINSKKGKYKNKPPEIIPAAKGVGENAMATVRNASPIGVGSKDDANCLQVSKTGTSRFGKAETPPLPPPKPKIKKITSVRNSQDHKSIGKDSSVRNEVSKSSTPYARASFIESDSISIANSDMTEDSLNTPVPAGNGRNGSDENGEDISEEENEPIDRCLAQLADSVIQPPDDTSLNRYLSQLGNVLATREESELDQCLSKLAISMNGNRATKGFNLSQHLPMCAFEHVCVDKGSDRSTPTSDRSSTTSRGSKSSQENLRKRTLTKSKHNHQRSVECKHTNGEKSQINISQEKNNHTPNRKVFNNGSKTPLSLGLIENTAHKGLLRIQHRITSTSEEEECGRASSLGSTRELETPIPQTTSDPEFVDSQRPRKKRPLFRRSKKGLNGTCRQHIQNNKFNKKETLPIKQARNSNTLQSSSSDVTVIQIEGNSKERVNHLDRFNTFGTLINVDSSDCSNSAEEQ